MSQSKTFYEILGDKNIELLVDCFYELVFKNEKLKLIFTGDKDEIKRKQFMFLSQFLGGPMRYSKEFGHPKMRMRHMPHKIDNEAKEEWLSCMKKAIGNLEIDERVKEHLYQVFPPVAQHMVNS